MPLSTINKIRFIRLFSSLMFWYGIEQLYLNNVLQDPNARAWVVTAFTVSMLLFNIPAGIFADKFGRKKAIVFGAVVQLIAVFLLGTSNATMQYTAATLLFGLSYSLMSNSASAYLYDYLKESGNTRMYARYQGSSIAFAFIGAGLGNVLSGFIADAFNLRMPYLMSLVPIVIMIFLAISLHDARPAKLLYNKKSAHLKQVVNNLKQTDVLLFGMRRILGTLVFLTICEFGQLYLLGFGISTKSLGILWAAVAAVCVAGLSFVKYASKHHEGFSILYAMVFVAYALIPGPIGIIIFIAIYSLNEMLATVTETEIHHVTDSAVRATVLSIITFAGYGAGIGVAWLYNHQYIQNGIIVANNNTSIIAAAVLVFTVLAVYLRSIRRRRSAF